MFEDVKTGDPIPRLASFWNNLKAAVAARRLLPGVGVRLRQMSFGTIVNFDSEAVIWDHPWRIAISGKEATLRRGLIDGMEPTIGDRLMSGDEKNPDPPRLTIVPSLFASNGISLICLELECSEQWTPKSAKIVQVARLDGSTTPDRDMPLLPPSLPGRRTRYPLVMLRRRQDESVAAFQIAYFHLRHIAMTPTGTTPQQQVRHFFFPG